MTGYDRKRLVLSHQSEQTVTSLEVDLFGAIDMPEVYFTYGRIAVPPGETVEHMFPDGFGAHWIRLASDSETRATATFIYE